MSETGAGRRRGRERSREAAEVERVAYEPLKRRRAEGSATETHSVSNVGSIIGGRLPLTPAQQPKIAAQHLEALERRQIFQAPANFPADRLLQVVVHKLEDTKRACGRQRLGLLLASAKADGHVPGSVRSKV